MPKNSRHIGILRFEAKKWGQIKHFLKLNNDTLFEFLIMFGQPMAFFRGQIRIPRCFLPLYMCFCESFQEKTTNAKSCLFPL